MPSVRTRLSLWHAGVLTVVICLFAAGTLLFVRVRLSRALDDQIAQDLATIEKVYREETGDLGELEHRMGLTLFELAEGPTVVYRATGWPPSNTRPYRIRTSADATHRISVARDETAVRQTLWTLALVFAMGIPCALGLAMAGGYLLAGRVLAPVGAMAETARRITADSLSARLPVDNPRDEFGRLAGVFNDTLVRLETAFEQPQIWGQTTTVSGGVAKGGPGVELLRMGVPSTRAFIPSTHYRYSRVHPAHRANLLPSFPLAVRAPRTTRSRCGYGMDGVTTKNLF